MGTALDDRHLNQVTWSTGSTGGVAQGTADWSIPSASLSEGLNTITVTAMDAAGNKGSATLRVMYTLPDTAAPFVSILAPTYTDTFTSANSRFNLAGKADNDSKLK